MLSVAATKESGRAALEVTSSFLSAGREDAEAAPANGLNDRLAAGLFKVRPDSSTYAERMADNSLTLSWLRITHAVSRHRALFRYVMQKSLCTGETWRLELILCALC